MNAEVTLPAIEDLLPHRGTMLLLEKVLKIDQAHALAQTRANCQTWYADSEGQMPAWIGIELMAQAIAAHVGWSKSQRGLPPKQGVLLGTRAYRTEASSFNGVLWVEAQLSFMDESGLGAYDCAISAEGKTVATATVKVFEPEDFQTFIHSQSSAT